MSDRNYIYPNTESIEILLDILIRVFESDVLSKIEQISAWINDIKIQSPHVIDTDNLIYEGKD